MSAIKQLYRRQ